MDDSVASDKSDATSNSRAPLGLGRVVFTSSGSSTGSGSHSGSEGTSEEPEGGGSPGRTPSPSPDRDSYAKPVASASSRTSPETDLGPSVAGCGMTTTPLLDAIGRGKADWHQIPYWHIFEVEMPGVPVEQEHRIIRVNVSYDVKYYPKTLCKFYAVEETDPDANEVRMPRDGSGPVERCFELPERVIQQTGDAKLASMAASIHDGSTAVVAQGSFCWRICKDP